MLPKRNNRGQFVKNTSKINPENSGKITRLSKGKNSPKPLERLNSSSEKVVNSKDLRTGKKAPGKVYTAEKTGNKRKYVKTGKYSKKGDFLKNEPVSPGAVNKPRFTIHSEKTEPPAAPVNDYDKLIDDLQDFKKVVKPAAAGDQPGAAAGDQPGAAAGNQPGAAAGNQPGAAAGDQPGAAAGDQPGAAAGDQPGAAAGDQPGAAAGDQPGAAAGGQPGAAAGDQPGAAPGLEFELINGYMLLMFIDMLFPPAISFVFNKFSVRFHVDSSDLSLTDQEFERLQPIADKAALYLNLRLNPVVMFVLGLGAIYGQKIGKYKKLRKTKKGKK